MDNGEIVFSVPIKSFDFEKSLMQEHFNENYMESDKYPVATFKGKINGFSTKNTAWQTARATGILSMHGIENNMTCDGKIKITPDSVSIEATFQVTISDYKIKIPKVVFYNIAEVVEVKVKFGYAKLD